MSRTRSWSPELFDVATQMSDSEWLGFMGAVHAVRRLKAEAVRTAENQRIRQTLDMTPEGYVREWVRHGERSTLPVQAWERAYQEAGMIEEARRLGYIEIGHDVRGTITLLPLGRALLEKVA